MNIKIETKFNNNYIIKYKINGGIKMMEKFNKELIIYYKKNRFGKIYKRVIKKLDNGKFSVISYYKENGVNRLYTSKINFNEEQIEELIKEYIYLYPPEHLF